MDIQRMLEWLKQTIEVNFSVAVKSLKSHTFTTRLESNKVEVTNKLPKEFAVNVLNPTQDSNKEIASLREEIVKSFALLGKTVQSIKPSGIVHVNNLKDLAIPPPLKEIKISNPTDVVRVSNLTDVTEVLQSISKYIKLLPKDIIIPEGKEEVSIKNIAVLTDILEKINKAIKAIKPSIFKETDIRGTDPETYVPVRLTDGTKFYKSIEDLSVAVGKSYSYSDVKGNKQQALVDKDRHMQVDVITMPKVELEVKDIEIGAVEIKDAVTDERVTITNGALNVNADIDVSLLATSAKQLPDNHQVTVSNQPPAITGYSTSAKQDDVNDTLILLRRIVQLLAPLATQDINNRQRVAVESAVISSGTITTVTTVGTVSNAVALGGVDYRFQMIDQARNTYANSIRNNLSFS